MMTRADVEQVRIQSVVKVTVILYINDEYDITLQSTNIGAQIIIVCNSTKYLDRLLCAF